MTQRSIIERRIAVIAARQHGLLTRQQALTAGLSASMIQRRLTDGRWVRAGAGVYRVAGVPVTWKQRALGACLVSGSSAVVSHKAAAALLDVVGFRPGAIDITVPAHCSARNSLATVHRRSLVLPRERVLVDRVPTVRPEQMLADIAGLVSPDRLEDAFDDVVCRRLATLDRIMTFIERHRGHRDIVILRKVAAAWDGDTADVTLAEMRLVRALIAAGLPPPVQQYEVWVDGVFLGRIDLAFSHHQARHRARQLPVACGAAPVPQRPPTRQPPSGRRLDTPSRHHRRRPRPPRAGR